MPSKKPTKAEVVNKTKRANNRLKVIGETCLDLAQGRDSRRVSTSYSLPDSTVN